MGKEKLTLREQCWRAAATHIERGDDLVYDLCSSIGQIFGNIKHMRMLRVMVANEMIDTMKKYATLEHFT
jgi:hypothetical protein